MPTAVNPAASPDRVDDRPTPGGRTALPARRRLRVVAVAALVAVVLGGCVAPKEQTKPPKGPGPSAETPTTPGDPKPDPTSAPELVGGDLEAFYDQEITWVPCGDNDCATVAAPLDWDEPAAGSIDLALERTAAAGPESERIGSLLINPGGPGGSGIDFLSYAVGGLLGDRVLDAYDVVAFDPRGVGASSAVACGDDATIDEFYTSDVAIESQEDVEAAREAVRVFGEACAEQTGPLLGEVDTVSAARDLDLLRDLLGDDELYYAGFSYGTFLGATYAGLYPERVGRLLLDGALDPSMSNDELIIGQAIGFEEALRAYVADCQAGGDCPLTGTVDEGMVQIAELVTRIEARPLDAGDGSTLNSTLAFYGIVVTLYDDGSWYLLTDALREALTANTGETLLMLANFYLDRTPDGAYLSNSMLAFNAINCLDYPMAVRDYDEMVAFAAEVEAVAPTFGADFGMAVGCETWPFQSDAERAPITAAGAAPILVVGTTGDPATPYEWSVALAEQLESGTLVTWEGEGHTAYGRSNSCVSDAVEDYLVDGVVPQDGLTC